MNTFKQSFLAGLIFSGTVLCSFLVYAATIVSVSPQTISTGDILGASWVQDVNNRLVSLSGSVSVPSGAIMAFYLSSCPAGWIAADGNNSTPNLRGEFIRGWDFNNSGIDNGRSLGSSQSRTVTYSYGNSNGGVPFAPFENMDAISNVSLWTSYNISPGGPSGWGNTKGTTRPRNIALLYCMKQ